jgi:hypothetical protein
MNEHFVLGQRLYQRYANITALLNAKYSSKEVGEN